MFKNMTWLNEPPKWSIYNDLLSVETGNKTDFWRKTFYGFVRDDGHFFYKNVKGDFTSQVTLLGDFENLYDQAGLMVRVDNKNWVKAGVEFTDSEMHVSTVITREYSDWSVLSLPDCEGELTLRVTRHGSAIRAQYLDRTNKWRLLRLGYLDVGEDCQVGIMCCSPERECFKVRFKDFTIAEPISAKLHD